MTQQQAAIEAILSERKYQDAKWGTVHEHPHEVGGWLLIIEQLLAEARVKWCRNSSDVPSLEEVRKIAAVALACLEQHGVPHRFQSPAQSNVGGRDRGDKPQLPEMQDWSEVK